MDSRVQLMIAMDLVTAALAQLALKPMRRRWLADANQDESEALLVS